MINASLYLDILLTVHLSIIYSLFPTWYTAFLFTYNNCYLLSSTCFRPHRPIIRRSKLYMQPMVFFPSADVFVLWPPRKNCRLCGFFSEFRHSLKKPAQTTVLSQRPHDKDICRGGEYHRLHAQFRPPDDGPVRPETCRGKRIADIVRRQKKAVYQVGNKE